MKTPDGKPKGVPTAKLLQRLQSKGYRWTHYPVDAQEEGPCPNCEQEVLEGEGAWEIHDTEDTVEAGFCNLRCAALWGQRLETANHVRRSGRDAQ